MVYLPLPDPAILFPGSLTSNDLAGNVHRAAVAETYNSGVGPLNQSPPRQRNWVRTYRIGSLNGAVIELA
jgi:hypothetical protein